ncbi:MAG TPA: carboxymuconolactone decarboxylase family protein [Steroidobacteraceae bacterium]|nr:carboxymuconolactone decarboxylase family protein [Steroidobacteraceae bacterium]
MRFRKLHPFAFLNTVGGKMAHIPTPPVDKITPEAKLILDDFQKNYGRPSHIYQTMSWNGRFVSAAADAWRRLVVQPSNLERWVKEAIVVITCSTQQTEYCVQGHSHALRRQGLSEAQVKAIQTHSFAGFSDPELSIFRFAHKAALAPKTLTKAEFDHLQQLGLSYETILEILGVVWVNTSMNMIVDALNVTRTDQQLKELERV